MVFIFNFLAEIEFNLSCCFADIHGIMLKSKELTDNDGFTAMDNYQAAPSHHREGTQAALNHCDPFTHNESKSIQRF